MYHVNARDLPGNDVSRTFEGGEHGPCTVSFFLVHNRPGQARVHPRGPRDEDRMGGLNTGTEPSGPDTATGRAAAQPGASAQLRAGSSHCTWGLSAT